MTAESKLGSPLGGSVSRTAQLRELLNAATPGPWAIRDDSTDVAPSVGLLGQKEPDAS